MQLRTFGVCLHGTTQSREFAQIEDVGNEALVWECSRSHKDFVIKQHKEIIGAEVGSPQGSMGR